MADVLIPPGLAKITRCGTCESTGRVGRERQYECHGCGGTGRALWRACPRCGDIGWDRLANGTYACRISCGYRWTEDHPGWQIQRLPGEEN